MNTPWRKASRSGGNGGACVEVRRHDATVQVRDFKDPHGPVLTFPPAERHAFVDALTNGEFDR